MERDSNRNCKDKVMVEVLSTCPENQSLDEISMNNALDLLGLQLWEMTLRDTMTKFFIVSLDENQGTLGQVRWSSGWVQLSLKHNRYKN
ncbi:hypothetical protein GBA52_026925 [Prunus armeniaca]|nr:hypothetical protein GBA52_026925 [Prunus armeniaca]